VLDEVDMILLLLAIFKSSGLSAYSNFKEDLKRAGDAVQTGA